VRAAVLSAPGAMRVADIGDPLAGLRDVVVRVTGVGLCGTDFHIFEGHANYHTDRLGRQIPLADAPQVLGHEIAGVVEARGDEVRDLAVGDPVVLDQGRNCLSAAAPQACEYCASGDSHQCETYGEHGITGLQGGLADVLVLPAVNAVRRGRSLPAEQAALTEPLACILHAHAAVGRASATARYALQATDAARRVQTVLIAGAGPAGLLFLQHLRHVVGFDGRILVSEPSPLRQTLARDYGADSVIDPRTADVVDATLTLTAGRRVEYLIDASGSAHVFRQMPGLIRKQATVLLYAHGQSGVDLGVLNTLQFREPLLVAPVGASGGFDEDGRPSVYRQSLELLESGRVDVSRIVTHRYRTLEEIPGAFGGTDRHGADYVKGVYAPVD
jgi:threonine dehydrogenase-like Zn-dependent dehydrogenase